MAKPHESEPDSEFKGRDGSRSICQIWQLQETGGAGIDFAQILRNAIAQSGLSQYQLAKAATVPQGAISVFLGGGDLRLSTFNRLAHVMGLELSQNPKKAPKKIEPATTSRSSERETRRKRVRERRMRGR